MFSCRGLISSLLVAGFTGCGVIFYLLDLIFRAVGGTRCATLPPCENDVYNIIESTR